MSTQAIDPVADEITWNPDLSPCADQRQCALRVRRGERVVKAFYGIQDDPAAPYSRLTVTIEPGQRVYLIRTGAELGVIGSGHAIRNHKVQCRFVGAIAQTMIVSALQESTEAVERSVKWFRWIQFDEPDLVFKPISASCDQFRRQKVDVESTHCR